jgi:dTDP-4-dehydrorhamnose reductase
VDLRNRDATLRLVEAVRPGIIIHAAGSDRSEDMVNTNRLTAHSVVEAAARCGCRLIALSTDLVFDGRNPPYDDYDPPNPLNPYGAIKAENESYFLARWERCLVVRTSPIYDLTDQNRQISWMRATIAAQGSVALFTDEVRQPIWAWNLASVLLELAGLDVTGILNVAGPQPLNRYEYGTALLRALGYNVEMVARTATAAEIAPHRPRDCTLRLDRVRALIQNPLIPLNDALELARRDQFPGQARSTTTSL